MPDRQNVEIQRRLRAAFVSMMVFVYAVGMARRRSAREKSPALKYGEIRLDFSSKLPGLRTPPSIAALGNSAL